jgi:hypothetical protein
VHSPEMLYFPFQCTAWVYKPLFRKYAVKLPMCSVLHFGDPGLSNVHIFYLCMKAWNVVFDLVSIWSHRLKIRELLCTYIPRCRFHKANPGYEGFFTISTSLVSEIKTLEHITCQNMMGLGG